MAVVRCGFDFAPACCQLCVTDQLLEAAGLNDAQNIFFDFNQPRQEKLPIDGKYLCSIVAFLNIVNQLC